MPLLLDSAFLFIIIFLPVCIVAFSVVFIRRWQSRNKKHPLKTELLHPPGHTIMQQVNQIEEDISAYVATMMLTPLVAYIFVLQGDTASSTSHIVLIISGPLILFYFAYRLFKLSAKKAQLRLGLEAEQAVGEELNQLMRAGYWVFHDLQADHHNVDHVVVGKTGVFAVETKGRSKRLNKTGKFEYNLRFDGETLHFPNWTENEPVNQVKRQATSLQSELNSAVGAKFKVKPVLAIPGWFVKTTAKTDVMLINGKNCLKLFEGTKGYALDDQLVERIVYQLERRCRNVSDQSYGKPENTC